MATTINADNGVVSGSAGLKSTSDSSGVLALQTNGTTAVTVDTSQNVIFAGTTTMNGAAGSGYTGFKNRIINGDMRIDQRNNGASITPANGGAAYIYALDRWRVFSQASNKFSVQQNAGAVTPPTGFSNYLGITSLAATSVSALDIYSLSQLIEGFNFADCGWGTANASSVTLSFRVYSSLTGTFGGALQNSAISRTYPFTFTVSTPNTWTTISLTIAGDTTGTWVGATNGAGLIVQFGLGIGSTYSGTAGAWAGTIYFSATGATSVVGTSGATFYITGVQLERGSNATSFEFIDYGRQLIQCQRYFEFGNTQIFSSNVTSANNYYKNVGFAVTKRASPTMVYTDTGNVSFPAGSPSANTQSASEASCSKTANGTSAGYFQFNWNASAEL